MGEWEGGKASFVFQLRLRSDEASRTFKLAAERLPDFSAAPL